MQQYYTVFVEQLQPDDSYHAGYVKRDGELSSFLEDAAQFQTFALAVAHVGSLQHGEQVVTDVHIERHDDE